MKKNDEIAELIFRKRNEMEKRRRNRKIAVILIILLLAGTGIVIAASGFSNFNFKAFNFKSFDFKPFDFKIFNVNNNEISLIPEQTTTEENEITTSLITTTTAPVTTMKNTTTAKTTTTTAKTTTTTKTKTTTKAAASKVTTSAVTKKSSRSESPVVTTVPKLQSEAPVINYESQPVSPEYITESPVTQPPVTAILIPPVTSYRKSSVSETVTTSATRKTVTESSTASKQTSALHLWTEQDVLEKFKSFIYNSSEYVTRGSKISSENIGKFITKILISAQDMTTSEIFTANASLYAVKELSTDYAFAVKFENMNDYYSYTCFNYYPETLGKLCSDISFEKNIKLNTLYLKPENEKADSYDKDFLIKIINENKNAECLADDKYHKVKYMISTDIDITGIKNKFISLTEDGWITTNIMDWHYSFYIGTDAVNEFGKTIKIQKIENNISSDNSGIG